MSENLNGENEKKEKKEMLCWCIINMWVFEIAQGIFRWKFLTSEKKKRKEKEKMKSNNVVHTHVYIFVNKSRKQNDSSIQ